jgi:hypothetical protein
MCSSHRKRVLISEPLPCPECGSLEMVQVIEGCCLADGVKVGRLAHYKCAACGACFFDDQAMHAIQSARASQIVARRAAAR